VHYSLILATSSSTKLRVLNNDRVDAVATVVTCAENRNSFAAKTEKFSNWKTQLQLLNWLLQLLRQAFFPASLVVQLLVSVAVKRSGDQMVCCRILLHEWTSHVYWLKNPLSTKIYVPLIIAWFTERVRLMFHFNFLTWHFLTDYIRGQVRGSRNFARDSKRCTYKVRISICSDV